MSKTLGWLRRQVTVRPWATLLVLLIVTVVLGAGAARRAALPDTSESLPQGSVVATALAEIDELFGAAGKSKITTLIFRGHAYTPDGLAQMDRLIDRITSDPDARELFAPTDPVAAPSSLVRAVLQAEEVKAALQLTDFESITQAHIDALLGFPDVGEALAAFTATEADGTPVTIATFRLLDTGEGRVDAAEERINDLAVSSEGPLGVSSISSWVVENEYKTGAAEGMALLLGLALLVIAGLILLFMRTLADLLLTLGGLFLSVIWITGTEGWLGPNALGLIGPPNSLTAILPIILIGLTVDYAIQTVSHYREQRLAGGGVVDAIDSGLRHVALPLTLAAVTTAVSLFANLFSPVGIVNDFGVVAGLGVVMSLLVMLTLLPAGRTIIDRRREAGGRLTNPRPISNALPGIRRMAEFLGRQVTRRPAPYILAIVGVTIGLGFAATNLKSEFRVQDILPRGGGVLEDLDTLEAAFGGGSTEMFNVLVKAEATDAVTILSLRRLTDAFADEDLRPAAATGPIQASYELLLRDWTEDSGEPGDKYDPELAALFREASAGVGLDADLMQRLLGGLEARDPTMAGLLVDNPHGIDAMLLQFPAYGGRAEPVRQLQDDLEALWVGDAEEITVTSDSIVQYAVSDSIADQQDEAVAATLVAALAVLALFFWITVRQPALALVAVAPIVLVLISVLGTMALAGIPYTTITSIITALSIGIGVDYTIHVIHRYREEYARERNPEQAAIRTLSTTGSALLGSALTTALGIGVLVFAPLAASQQFAVTAAITIGYSLIASILLVPPAMTVWGAYQNVRLRSKMLRWSDELDEVIDAVHRSYG